MTENIIKWRTVLIGVVVILASYVISDIMSVVSIILPLFLLVGLLVGFIINETEKMPPLTELCLSNWWDSHQCHPSSVDVPAGLRCLYRRYNRHGTDLRGARDNSSRCGGVLGSLLRIEFDKSEMEYEEVEE